MYIYTHSINTCAQTYSTRQPTTEPHPCPTFGHPRPHYGAGTGLYSPRCPRSHTYQEKDFICIYL